MSEFHESSTKPFLRNRAHKLHNIHIENNDFKNERSLRDDS